MSDLIATSAASAEAGRIMTICNACRYCEGICATFQAMTDQRTFSPANLDYLANLCHNCTACYHDCQYAEPHEFAVNVPRTLTELRVESYGRYAWPEPLARLFERNGLIASLATALAITLVLLLSFLLNDGTTMTSAHTGPGAFYAVISHTVMVAVAGGTFGFSVLALAIGCYRFNVTTGAAARPHGMIAGDQSGISAWRQALVAAVSLQNLDGGHGEGCNVADTTPSNTRRWAHHATLWGFLLCFAATCVATFYDYVLGLVAPYSLTSLPVLLGTVGGVLLMGGTAALARIKLEFDPRPVSARYLGMDYAFIALLFASAVTGLALLVLRETTAMPILLAVHLGVVLALFVTLPYGKFVHGLYRLVALLAFARTRREA